MSGSRLFEYNGATDDVHRASILATERCGKVRSGFISLYKIRITCSILIGKAITATSLPYSLPSKLCPRPCYHLLNCFATVQESAWMDCLYIRQRIAYMIMYYLTNGSSGSQPVAGIYATHLSNQCSRIS